MSLTQRQSYLYRAVRQMASSIDEQMAFLLVLASRHAASEADVTAVRERLMANVEDERRPGGDR